MEEIAKERLKAFSDILQDIAQVVFASMLLGPLLSGSIDSSLVYRSSLLIIVTWISSVLLIRE
jgi:hypothetical protein